MSTNELSFTSLSLPCTPYKQEYFEVEESASPCKQTQKSLTLLRNISIEPNIPQEVELENQFETDLRNQTVLGHIEDREVFYGSQGLPSYQNFKQRQLLL